MWCEDCNRVAYCSRECRAKEARNHSQECDGRWKQTGIGENTGELQKVAGRSARREGFEPTEVLQESPPRNGQDVSEGDDLSDEHPPVEGTEGHQAEELKDSIIDLVLSARQREEVWKEACPDARKHHEERCAKEACRIEELVAAFRGGSARLRITADELEHARQWARCHLEPWARQQREDRLARWWKAEAVTSWVRVRFRGIPATNSDGACSLLEQAGICIAKD